MVFEKGVRIVSGFLSVFMAVGLTPGFYRALEILKGPKGPSFWPFLNPNVRKA